MSLRVGECALVSFLCFLFVADFPQFVHDLIALPILKHFDDSGMGLGSVCGLAVSNVNRAKCEQVMSRPAHTLMSTSITSKTRVFLSVTVMH